MTKEKAKQYIVDRWSVGAHLNFEKHLNEMYDEGYDLVSFFEKDGIIYFVLKYCSYFKHEENPSNTQLSSMVE